MHIKSFIMASAFFATGSALAQSATELMTPETLWRMGRIGSVSLSPDGSRLLYSVTHYSKEENKGNCFGVKSSIWEAVINVYTYEVYGNFAVDNGESIE